MARILITSWGSYGDVYPYIGLAHALTGRGHQPVLAMPAYYREAIEREGLDYRPVGPDLDPNDRATIAQIMDPRKGTETLLREVLLPPLRRTYDELRDAVRGADLLVSHPATYAAPVLAQKLQLPWAATVLAPLSFFSATDLPVFPPAPRLVHLRRLGPWVGRMMIGFAHWATREWMEPVYQLRAELGLPRGEDPLYRGQFSPALTLALFSRVLAKPQPDWPSNVKISGFVFYNGPDRLSPELEAFLDAGSPPVVFTLGTSAVHAAGQFYEESAAAVARLGLRAVLLTGGLSENHPMNGRSADLYMTDKAPHQLLFPRAAAIVHQGGIGTTAQALRSGRPMLVVPHAHDQPDNAFRVTNLGVARTVFPADYRGSRVAGVLRRLLDDGAALGRATEVAEVVNAEGGAQDAASALSCLVR